MEVVIPFLVIFVIIGSITLFFISTSQKFRENIIRLNEAESTIDAVLRKRYDWLNKSFDIIKRLSDDENIMPIVSQLRSQTLSNYDFDKKLCEAIDEMKAYKEDFENLKNNDDYLKIEINLLESEVEIVSLRKYYNDVAKTYNREVRTFPSSFVALIMKHKAKSYYEERAKKDFLEELRS
jgi:LemA protein